ncbi:hypothetical protein BB558_003153 [Smittium angustum]|uniref:Core-binding (CB) domain-containing protein n=1 Tax=Smittium angustum TaxID=133377 RepID=A0A2U1J6Z8_SMIAN|nr:hypothetical protein BB558_003153 [Smittium angustum]
MEFNSAGDTEGIKGENNNYSSCTNVGFGNLISRSGTDVYTTATISSSISQYTRSRKQQVTADKKQVVVPNGLEDQRNILASQGLNNQAINIVAPNPKMIKRMRLYDPIQQHFFDWREENGIVNAISAVDMVNYLAMRFVEDKLAISTIKSYKSAIMHLCNDLKTISQSVCFIKFFKAIKKTKLKLFVKPIFDTTPIVKQIKDWSSNLSFGIKELSSKLFWLLAICAFMQASDIARVDDNQIIVLENCLKLVVILPKELRAGKPIIKPCEIRSHYTSELCPIKCYDLYWIKFRNFQNK